MTATAALADNTNVVLLVMEEMVPIVVPEEFTNTFPADNSVVKLVPEPVTVVLPVVHVMVPEMGELNTTTTSDVDVKSKSPEVTNTSANDVMLLKYNTVPSAVVTSAVVFLVVLT